MLSVDINISIAHRTVKDQSAGFSFCIFWRLELKSVPAWTDERQSSCPTSMLHCLLLTVLRNGNVLFVVIDAERTINSPIMRNPHGLPTGILIICV